MARELTVGNGSLQVMFDAAYRLRDVYFPHVGQEDHTAGHAFRFGVFADGQLLWVDDPSWERELGYEPDTLVTSVRLTHARLGLRLECNDAVDFHENVYLRKVIVHDLLNRAREIRLFFHQDFHLYGSDVADTGLYEPRLQGILHYKGHRYFLASTWREERPGVEEWAVGIKEHDGKEGTWRDAEDGRLGGNAVAQGSVDSTIAVSLVLEPNREATCWYWIGAGTKYGEVKVLNAVVLDKTPAELLRRTESYWRLWVRKCVPGSAGFAGLGAEQEALYKRSLLVLGTLADSQGGIVAANDSDLLQFGRDTYGYVWPRDGARAAYAFTRAGFIDIPRRFFRFCADFITEEGYLLHKYNPDGSLGSSWHPWFDRGQMQIPIQEDETALVLWALWQHFARHRDVEFVKPLYRSLITRAADFLEDYRDDTTGLPRPSYDLWEERYGVHTFTVAAVSGGLEAAASFAESFGEERLARKYRAAIAELKDAARRILFSPEHGRFARGLKDDGSELDLTLDASLFGVPAFGLLPVEDPMVVGTMKQVEEDLAVRTPVGGVARYRGDRFQHVTDDVERIPGNPWIVCTLWVAQYRIAAARSLEDLEPASALLGWASRHARPSGVLPEQLDPFGERPLSVCPLGWSHAEYVITVLDYLDKHSTLSKEEHR